jgi:hypothetical protein
MIVAQENAAERFLEESEQELENILLLGKGKTSDVKHWLNCFSGQQTPFEFNEMVDMLKQKWGTALTKEEIRENLTRMKDFGMFESLSREGSRWRVSRLYKSSLDMKFFRR